MASFDTSSVQNLYRSLKGYCKNTSKNFAIMKVAFADDKVAQLYETYIDKHNNSIVNNAHCDSGFDLYLPNEARFREEFKSKFLDMQIKTEMVYCDISDDYISPTAFHLYARSSISKTPLMLANHVGIIDSGYRGTIIGAFRWLYAREDPLSNDRYIVEKGTRLLQICHPTLCPIYIMVVPESELSSTQRGEGGFGSTGV